MQFLYNISIRFYILAIRIASLFRPKAKLWIKGRKSIFQKLKAATENQNNIVLFHCASLGEFEQGRPIMEGYKHKYPTHKILLTFFSPSGFEIQKNYNGADWVFYLPADTPSNAKQFIEIVKPIKAIFVKYEFWLNYMTELKRTNIPFYSVSAIFRKEQVFFKYKWFAKQLNNVSHFFVQDKTSSELLKSIGYNNTTISGDTRFDRVKINASSAKEIPLVTEFCKQKPTIICGSTWPKDEQLIANFIKENQQYNYIIAPHELSKVQQLQKRTNSLLFSDANEQNIHDSNVLIIDSIGLLASIYKYGTISYIGGGFGKGIHNILEPAAFDTPIIFGPHYNKFNEAKDLIEIGGAKSIKNFNELQEAFSYFFSNYQKNICKNYIMQKCGSTKLVIKKI